MQYHKFESYVTYLWFLGGSRAKNFNALIQLPLVQLRKHASLRSRINCSISLQGAKVWIFDTLTGIEFHRKCDRSKSILRVRERKFVRLCTFYMSFLWWICFLFSADILRNFAKFRENFDISRRFWKCRHWVSLGDNPYLPTARNINPYHYWGISKQWNAILGLQCYSIRHGLEKLL